MKQQTNKQTSVTLLVLCLINLINKIKQSYISTNKKNFMLIYKICIYAII